MSEFFIVVNFHNFPQKKDLAAYNLISRSNQSRLTRRGSEAFLDSYFVLGAVDCVLQRWCGYTRRVGGPGEVEYFISGLTHTHLRCEDDVVHTLITQPHELLKLLVWLARAVYPQLTSSIPGLKLLQKISVLDMKILLWNVTRTHLSPPWALLWFAIKHWCICSKSTK